MDIPVGVLVREAETGARTPWEAALFPSISRRDLQHQSLFSGVPMR
jgi:hypothetical protein